MKRKPKKMALSRETLGSLEVTLLKEVAGCTVVDTCTVCSDRCTKTGCTECPPCV
jgi:hypothetical protein